MRAPVVACHAQGAKNGPEVMTTRLVIVDDNAQFLAAAQDLLERQGVEVLAVGSTGDDAARLVAQLRPDVVLVDVDLGSESGFDVARRLHGEHGAHAVLISAYNESEFTDLIAASPALGFIPKAKLSARRVTALLDERRPDDRA